MPKGRGKEYQGSDETSFEPPEEPTGYEAGQEESQKIENIIARRRKPEPTPTPAPEPTPEPVARPPRKPLGTGEPIYLYISTGLGQYTLVDRQFNSRVEAHQYAETNFPKTKTKIMSETEVKGYLEKLARRQAKTEAVKEYAKEKVTATGRGLKQAAVEMARPAVPEVRRYAGGFLRASEGVARQAGFTRQQMEPEIRRAWGVSPGPYAQEPTEDETIAMEGTPISDSILKPDRSISWTLVNYNGKIYTLSRSGSPSVPIVKAYAGRSVYDENMKRYQPARPAYQQPTRQPYQPPQQPRPPYQPQQQQRRFTIQQPRSTFHFAPPSDRPFQPLRMQAKPVFGRTQVRQQPQQSQHFNLGGLHMARPHFVGGRPRQQPRQQPQPQTQQQTKPRKKRHKKSRSKGRSKK